MYLAKMPHKGNCVQCQRGLFEWSMEVKKLPCKHYCHSSCIVALPNEWGSKYYKEDGWCPRCGHKIHRDWPKETLEQQSTYEEVDSKVFYEGFYKEFSLRALDTIGNRFGHIQYRIDHLGMSCQTEIGNFVEYMGMLQKVLTLVQQLEDNDRKDKEK